MGAVGVRPGFIYALWSDASPFIKIGRTATSPNKRLQEINSGPPYRDHGPWHLLDCKKVVNCIEVETALHRSICDCKTFSVLGANELFTISRAEALALLQTIPEADLYEAAPIGRMRIDAAFNTYLSRLFELTGLEVFLDQQEAWTFSLFPKTAGGRHFTLNIGRHEVAYSSLNIAEPKQPPEFAHMIVCDALVCEDKVVRKWLADHGGEIEETPYASALPNAVCLHFYGKFEEVFGILDLDSVRRGLIAYWFDALLRMRRNNSRSFFAKSHNYSAVSSIIGHMREMRRFRGFV